MIVIYLTQEVKFTGQKTLQIRVYMYVLPVYRIVKLEEQKHLSFLEEQQLT